MTVVNHNLNWSGRQELSRWHFWLWIAMTLIVISFRFFICIGVCK
jgi:hypothetical protein